ncbi:MAG: hypothetical protein ACRDJH_17485 [Thermomicrobiales bacterium]
MGSTTMEIGRALSVLIGAGCVFFATRPVARTRRDRGIAMPDRVTLVRHPDEPGFAHLRMGAAGRNRWDRRDLARGIGVDPSAGEPDLVVWPGLGLPLRLGRR